MIKFAVFASGSGSNFQSIVEAVNRKEIKGELALLVCDKPGALVVERAATNNIPCFSFSAKEYPSKESYEEEILKRLKEAGVELIVLAGYMRLIGSTLLANFEGRIVNIHPSLLPSFPGLDAIGQAYEAGVIISGVTIHFVDAGMDTGPIIAQEALPILEEDTHETFQKKIQQIEHKLYPVTIQKVIEQL